MRAGSFRYVVAAAAWAPEGTISEEYAPDTLVSEVYADELELGGVISAFQVQPEEEPAVDPDAPAYWTAQDAYETRVYGSRGPFGSAGREPSDRHRPGLQGV